MSLQHPENLPPNQLLAAVDGAVFIQVDGKTAALIDRLVHYCHLVTIRGNSYRMRQHTELWQTLHANQEPARGQPPPACTSAGDDELRLVPSPTCQIFNRRSCQIFGRR